MQLFQQTFQHEFTTADKAASDYAYVPFDLPAAATKLTVRYHYSAPISSDESEGGNVVDIGLIDPDGAQFPGGPGFRGWSGSARNEFFVAVTEATPGYIPGPLPAGRYHLLLGLYRVWSQGVECEFEIEAQLGASASGMLWPATGLASNSELTMASAGERWLCGDLQCHTFHSDAKGSPEQLIEFAHAAGLDFLAVTDHNTISHQRILPPMTSGGCLILPGQEVTTYYGHINVWGATTWCDFRCREATDMRAVIDFAHSHGGVCSINHPKPGGPAWEYGFELPVQAMEVWQGPWIRHNDISLDLWDRLLSQGRRLPAVGGSDFHCPDGPAGGLSQLGQPLTWVFAEPTVAAILDAVCAGHVSISAGPGAPMIVLQGKYGDQHAAMGDLLHCRAQDGIDVHIEVTRGAGYDLHLIVDGDVHSVHALRHQDEKIALTVAAQRYVRAEVVGDARPEELPPERPANLDLQGWRWALSNPIYVQSENFPGDIVSKDAIPNHDAGS